MSYNRREFLKNMTLGGLALFADDWLKRVAETKAATDGKQLPDVSGKKRKKGTQVLNAFWVEGAGYFELCLNGTKYDEVPKFEDDDDESFDESEHEQEDDESKADFNERVEAAREEWDEERASERREREEEHELDWYRQSCPGAQAVPYLQGLFDALDEQGTQVSLADVSEVGSIDFYDGACPGNDTYVAATAPDYATLAALQRVLKELGWNCQVVIVEPNPNDAADRQD